jgi:hypothetical protein
MPTSWKYEPEIFNMAGEWFRQVYAADVGDGPGKGLETDVFVYHP